MYRLFENKGGKFEDVTAKAGLLNAGYGLNAIAADFNNDGWQDIYVTNDYDGPTSFISITRMEPLPIKSMKALTYFLLQYGFGCR